jgi:hypothetical protein
MMPQCCPRPSNRGLPEVGQYSTQVGLPIRGYEFSRAVPSGLLFVQSSGLRTRGGIRHHLFRRVACGSYGCGAISPCLINQRPHGLSAGLLYGLRFGIVRKGHGNGLHLGLLLRGFGQLYWAQPFVGQKNY